MALAALWQLHKNHQVIIILNGMHSYKVNAQEWIYGRNYTY